MVASWYDAGTRLGSASAPPFVSVGGFDGVVVPTGRSRKDESLLQRYMQLRAVLPDATPLSDAAVESLIIKAEKAAQLVTIDERKLAGEWRQFWQRTAKEGTASQKALSPVSQKLFQNFIVDADGDSIFRNVVQVTRRRFLVVFDVAYNAPDASRDPPNRL